MSKRPNTSAQRFHRKSVGNTNDQDFQRPLQWGMVERVSKKVWPHFLRLTNYRAEAVDRQSKWCGKNRRIKMPSLSLSRSPPQSLEDVTDREWPRNCHYKEEADIGLTTEQETSSETVCKLRCKDKMKEMIVCRTRLGPAADIKQQSSKEVTCWSNGWWSITATIFSMAFYAPETL